jgi:polyphosphate glucokinase
VKNAIDLMRTLTNFDHLYIGGGNAEKLNFELPSDITTVPNECGVTGGAWLWRKRE